MRVRGGGAGNCSGAAGNTERVAVAVRDLVRIRDDEEVLELGDDAGRRAYAYELKLVALLSLPISST